MIAGSRLAASMFAVALVGGGIVARAVGSSGASAPALAITGEGVARTVELSGLDDASLRQLAAHPPSARAWSDAFALYVDDSTTSGKARPAVVARYEVVGGRVRLSPLFPLTPGVSYRTRVSPSGLAGLLGGKDASVRTTVEERFTIPLVHLERTTHLVGVYPSSGIVPANLLRWYLEFSAPMEPGSALEHVHLLDASGNEVPRAFLAGEELWSPDRRRLTLLFDPGRVKRGIRSNVEAGAPLIEGRRYRLSIDAEWRDGRGAALASGFDHPFEVGADDRTSPDPSQWRLAAPKAGTREPLRVDVTEPLDHALLSRMLGVVDASGRRVPGRTAVGEGDATWSFVPDEAWSAGAFTLRTDELLEDLAGNNLARVFDADLQRTSAAATRRTSVAFAVR